MKNSITLAFLHISLSIMTMSCRLCSAAFVGIGRRVPTINTRSHVVRSASTLLLSSTREHRPLSNEELVQRRLQAGREKQNARDRSVLQRTNRNLHIKRLLHNSESNSTTKKDDLFIVEEDGCLTPPPLYAIKVTVDEALRSELQLSGKEKRGRVFVERGSEATQSLRALTMELHGFFRALRKDTFVLRASIPNVNEDGTVTVAALTQENGNADNASSSWSIETDNDVVRAFAKADSFFQECSLLKRPSIILHVERNPTAPPRPPPPHYYDGMADPKHSPTLTMLSFYAFPPAGIEDPDEFATMLRKLWKPFDALGRVYVAQEGVNAQMSIPSNVLDNFMECCRSIPELGEYMENGINVDPIPLTREQFAKAGSAANADTKAAPPFKNLHVRVRSKIVADGLDMAYDWQNAGYDMSPLEWHEKIKQAREQQQNDDEATTPIILDCRNIYETNVGRFEGAEPLDTESFRESWKVLEDRLADTPKDTPIMTYCTGGIRCVKTGAYLTQELGFTNISRLAGGIIAYDRTLQELAPQEESMFKGTNFVFDGRLGRPITEDALGVCVTCGSETSLVSNCRNENCHTRIIQCEECRTNFQGTCSDACRQRLLNGSMRPRRTSPISDTTERDNTDVAKYTTIEEYSSGHSSPVPSAYAELELNTRALIPNGSHMLAGSAQGRLLSQLASMSREGRVLELGTFTGYATSCFLEGAANAARVTSPSVGGSRAGGPYVMSMERDSKAFELAAAHLKVIAEHGFGEAAAEQLCALRRAGSVLANDATALSNNAFVSLNYDSLVGCELVRVSDALAAVEEMAAGRGELVPAPFDIVFVDADKTRLFDYADACLSSDRILKKGGLIIVDNVLWKGLVLEASSGDFVSLSDDADTEEAQLRKNRRARKLANKMHRFNAAIVKEERAEVLVLPIRDGLTVIRKK